MSGERVIKLYLLTIVIFLKALATHEGSFLFQISLVFIMITTIITILIQ